MKKVLFDELLASVREHDRSARRRREREKKRGLPIDAAAHYRARMAAMNAAMAVNRYEKFKNPAHLWDAFALARNGGAPVPNEVVDYLDRIAANILAAPRARNALRRWTNLPAALEFKVKSGSRRPSQSISEEAALFDVEGFKGVAGTKQADAIALAARVSDRNPKALKQAFFANRRKLG